MKTRAFIILLIGMNYLHAQEQLPEILLEQLHISKVVKLEERHGSENITDTSFGTILSPLIYPSSGKYELADPYTFVRSIWSSRPDAEINYFFDKEKRIVRYIKYWWKVFDYGNEETKRISEFDTLYEQLKASLEEALGQQVYSSGEHRQKKEVRGTIYNSREDRWKVKNQTVKLNLEFSKLKKRDASGTHEMELVVYWE